MLHRLSVIFVLLLILGIKGATLPSFPPRKTLLPMAQTARFHLDHLNTTTTSSQLISQTELIPWAPHDRRQLSWGLQIAYEGTTFFDGFDFFTDTDPSHGLVNYVDHDTAFSDGLVFWTEDGIPGIQAEHWATLPEGTPRNSIRISSKALFAGGLFIVDLALMPWGCGVWPAFWTLGYDGTWPDTEGIQDATNNQMTIHTLPGCTINTSAAMTGHISQDNCDSTTGASGCSIVSDSAQSYGAPFNAAGGGVFAMLWDGDGIRMWNWIRANIPSDITGGTPSPTGWGTPVATWDSSTCDPGYYFQAQELVLNIDLCGDWAGGDYQYYSYCPGTCASQIANPANLQNTVMLVNYIQVYQQTGVAYIATQAETTANQTGAGGAVGKNTTNGLGGVGEGNGVNLTSGAVRGRWGVQVGREGGDGVRWVRIGTVTLSMTLVVALI